jgi:hypothetical protein
VAEVELGVRTPWWCRVVQVLQWLLLTAVLTGLVWLISLGAGGTLVAPVWYGWSVPALLLAGGVAAGLLLSLVCRGLVRISARMRARAVRRRLRAAVAEVTERLVVVPVRAELEAYQQARSGLADALR